MSDCLYCGEKGVDHRHFAGCQELKGKNTAAKEMDKGKLEDLVEVVEEMFSLDEVEALVVENVFTITGKEPDGTLFVLKLTELGEE